MTARQTSDLILRQLQLRCYNRTGAVSEDDGELKTCVKTSVTNMNNLLKGFLKANEQAFTTFD
jgi:hypothetical protein